MTRKSSQRDAVLISTLPHVPFDGWTMDAVYRGAGEVGYSKDTVNVLFPDGVRAVIGHWLDLSDRQMLEDISGQDLEAMRIRDRITLLVRKRLERWAPHREAVRRALSLSLIPGYVENSIYRGITTVDVMWRAAGDRSTDFNFYTKRGLLGAVYSSTLLGWLEDTSEDFTDSWAFLDRRISNVMQIPKLQRRLKDAFEQIPRPTKLFRKLRRACL